LATRSQDSSKEEKTKMANVDLDAVKEVAKTIRELNTDRNLLAGIISALIVLLILVLYLCIAVNHRQPINTENNSFCSTKKDTIYIMQLKDYENSDINKIEVPK
jgi:hypothetical protein